MIRALLALMVVAAAVGCRGDADDVPPPGRRVRAKALGVSFNPPDGWVRDERAELDGPDHMLAMIFKSPVGASLSVWRDEGEILGTGWSTTDAAIDTIWSVAPKGNKPEIVGRGQRRIGTTDIGWFTLVRPSAEGAAHATHALWRRNGVLGGANFQFPPGSAYEEATVDAFVKSIEWCDPVVDSKMNSCLTESETLWRSAQRWCEIHERSMERAR